MDLSHKGFDMSEVTEPFATFDTMQRQREMLAYETKHGNTRDVFFDEETGSYTAERTALHDQIVDEMLGLERASDETEITIGKFGALPEGGTVANERQMTVITGPAAAGKSTLVAEVAESLRALEMDSDIIKRKLVEEFDGGRGVGRVHLESKDILAKTMQKAIESGQNMVVPKNRGAMQEMLGESPVRHKKQGMRFMSSQ